MTEYFQLSGKSSHQPSTYLHTPFIPFYSVLIQFSVLPFLLKIKNQKSSRMASKCMLLFLGSILISTLCSVSCGVDKNGENFDLDKMLDSIDRDQSRVVELEQQEAEIKQQMDAQMRRTATMRRYFESQMSDPPRQGAIPSRTGNLVELYNKRWFGSQKNGPKMGPNIVVLPKKETQPDDEQLPSIAELDDLTNASVRIQSQILRPSLRHKSDALPAPEQLEEMLNQSERMSTYHVNQQRKPKPGPHHRYPPKASSRSEKIVRRISEFFFRKRPNQTNGNSSEEAVKAIRKAANDQ